MPRRLRDARGTQGDRGVQAGSCELRGLGESGESGNARSPGVQESPGKLRISNVKRGNPGEPRGPHRRHGKSEGLGSSGFSGWPGEGRVTQEACGKPWRPGCFFQAVREDPWRECKVVPSRRLASQGYRMGPYCGDRPGGASQTRALGASAQIGALPGVFFPWLAFVGEFLAGTPRPAE